MGPFAMPLFSFRTQNGGHSSISDPCELPGRDAAWKELTRVCADLVGESCSNLTFSNQKLQAWTCYTPMLVAPHSSARASGHAVVGGHSFSARTGWYVTA